MTVHTERVGIGPLSLDHAETMYAYRSNPRVSRYQSWEPRSVEEVRRFISSQVGASPDAPGRWRQLGIFELESGRLAGDVGVHVLEYDPRQVEVGITVAPAFQGRGLATEALRALLRHLFVDLGKHRVCGSVDPRNSASIALLERVGMRLEAHFVESLWFKGDWADDVIYAMLRREYQP